MSVDLVRVRNDVANHLRDLVCNVLLPVARCPGTKGLGDARLVRLPIRVQLRWASDPKMRRPHREAEGLHRPTRAATWDGSQLRLRSAESNLSIAHMPERERSLIFAEP